MKRQVPLSHWSAEALSSSHSGGRGRNPARSSLEPPNLCRLKLKALEVEERGDLGRLGHFGRSTHANGLPELTARKFTATELL